MLPLPRDPNRRVGAPQREAEEQVADVDGDDRRTHRAADRATHARGQREAGNERRDLSGVEVRRDEPGEGRDADLVEALVALETDLGAGEERHEGEDADRAGDHGQRARAQGDLGDQPGDLLLVVDDRAPRPPDRAAVERQLLAHVLQGAERLADGRPQEPQRPGKSSGRGHQIAFWGTTWKYTVVTRKFTTNSSMKAMITDWLTASPTPFGPPFGLRPL